MCAILKIEVAWSQQSERSRKRTSDFKIDKNVKNVEIDHNGAYQSGCKCTRPLIQRCVNLNTVSYCQNSFLKNSAEECHPSVFCFVLLSQRGTLRTSKLPLSALKTFCVHLNNGSNFLLAFAKLNNFVKFVFNIFYFVCSSCVVRRSSQICSSARRFRSRWFDRGFKSCCKSDSSRALRCLHTGITCPRL